MLALFVSPDVRSATFAFTIVAVFDSPVDNLKAHVKRHKALFPILADESNVY